MSALRSLGRQFKRKTRPGLSPIGLEFSTERLHMVQLATGLDGRPVIRARAVVPYALKREDLLNSPSAVKKLIKQALAASPFKGRTVITALAPEDTRLLSVTYQTRPGQSDDAAIAKLMAERIDDDLDQFVIDYIPVRTEARDGDRLALVVISDRSKVIGHLELLRKAGLEVEALEIAPVAIRRMVSTLVEDGNVRRDVLVINVGEHLTHLIVVSGRRLLFEQRVDFGVRQLMDALTDALDLTPSLTQDLIARRGLSGADDDGATGKEFNTVAEIVQPQFRALVNEIRRALLFATSETRGGHIKEAYLLGDIARWPGVTTLLSELTELQVRTPPMLAGGEGVDLDGSDTCIGSVIAAGLALRGLQADA